MEQLHNQMLVKQLKAFCVQERTRIENRHRFGISGTEIVEEYTRLADNVIQRIYQASIQGGILSKEMPLAILAVGGYGRGALNPYSDIDVMLVYDSSKLTTTANRAVRKSTHCHALGCRIRRGAQLQIHQRMHQSNVSRPVLEDIYD